MLLAIGMLSIAFALADVESVTPNSPATNFWTNDTTPDFNITVAGNETLYNCTLYINGTQKAQNTSTLNNTATIFTSSALTDSKGYLWQMNCTNGTTGASTLRTINIDSVAPTVTLTKAPTSGRLDVRSYVTATCSATDATSTTLTYLITLTTPSGATHTSTSASYRFSGSQLGTIGKYTLDCAVTDQGSNVGSGTQMSFTTSNDITAQQVIAEEEQQQTVNKNTIILIIVVLLIIIFAAVGISKKKKK